MSQVSIYIDLDPDAFRGNDCGPELARVLERLAHDVRHVSRRTLETYDPVMRDVNGNRCGWVQFEMDPDNSDEEIDDLLDDMCDDCLIDALTELGEESIDEDTDRLTLRSFLRDYIQEGAANVEDLRRRYCLPY